MHRKSESTCSRSHFLLQTSYLLSIRTCREFQGENFEELVDWALEYISDIERRAGGPTGPPTRGDGSSPGQSAPQVVVDQRVPNNTESWGGVRCEDQGEDDDAPKRNETTRLQ